MTTAADLNWTQLGRELRASADDAHEGDTPSVELAYSFLLDNPECFHPDGAMLEEWPPDMPQTAPVGLVKAYYGVAS